MSFKHLFIFVLLFYETIAFAQFKTHEQQKKEKEDKKKESKTKNLVYGGNFSATFQPTLVDISPTLGYSIKNKIIPGIGLTYTYFKPKKNDETGRPESSTYGGRAYLQFRPVKWFQFQGEYEAINIQDKSNPDNRSWQMNPQVGGGLNIPLAKMATINFTALYNLNYQKDFSLYPSPWVFRLGFSFN